FFDLLKRIGVTDIDPRAYDMLYEGYRMSGFWYYLGGQGLPVSQENWRKHAEYRYASQPRGSYRKGDLSDYVLTKVIYKTKDGTPPEASEHNRRDSNLVNLGKILLDCSELV